MIPKTSDPKIEFISKNINFSKKSRTKKKINQFKLTRIHSRFVPTQQFITNTVTKQTQKTTKLTHL